MYRGTLSIPSSGILDCFGLVLKTSSGVELWLVPAMLPANMGVRISWLVEPNGEFWHIWELAGIRLHCSGRRQLSWGGQVGETGGPSACQRKLQALWLTRCAFPTQAGPGGQEGEQSPLLTTEAWLGVEDGTHRAVGSQDVSVCVWGGDAEALYQVRSTLANKII